MPSFSGVALRMNRGACLYSLAPTGWTRSSIVYQRAPVLCARLAWIDRRPLPGVTYRFDVIGVMFEKGRPHIEHVQGAFRAG